MRSGGRDLPNLFVTRSPSSGPTYTRMAVHLNASHSPKSSTISASPPAMMVLIRFMFFQQLRFRFGDLRAVRPARVRRRRELFEHVGERAVGVGHDRLHRGRDLL